VLHRRVLEARVAAPCPCAARRSTLGARPQCAPPRQLNALSCNPRRRESCAELAISCSAVARYYIHAHSLQRLRGGALGALYLLPQPRGGLGFAWQHFYGSPRRSKRSAASAPRRSAACTRRSRDWYLAVAFSSSLSRSAPRSSLQFRACWSGTRQKICTVDGAEICSVRWAERGSGGALLTHYQPV